MAKPLGFGIIGCGLIAQFHARAIAELPGTKLVGCQSRKPENAAKLAAGFPGCTPYADLNELLRRPDLDVVCVCTPSGAHLEPALAAAAAKKHVVVEKPLE